MLDIAATLTAGNGVVEECVVHPPAGPSQPLWVVAVQLRAREVGVARRFEAGDYPLQLVGACGTTRTDTMVRGAGEAVERFALMTDGRAAVRAKAADLGSAALSFVEYELADPAALHVELDWLTGRSLSEDRSVLVPAQLVDYPVAGARLFDPSPSGAASGAGAEAATRAALLEIVERDAVLIAWAQQARLASVRPRSGGDRVSHELSALHAKCAELNLETVFGRIPSAVPGVDTLVCVLRDPAALGHDLVTAGCKASPDGVLAMLGALREAVQMRGLLLGVHRHYGDAPLPLEIDGDLARARHLTTASGAEALWRWALGFREEPWIPRRFEPASLSVHDIVKGIVADGCAPPVAVELTDRLPEPLRRMGWAVVKVIAPGYQPLRMDERLPFGWLRPRLGHEPTTLPHPLV